MSNLLDRASILLTPTAVSDGTLHSVKPVQTFGSELVVNGDFADNSTWQTQSSITFTNGTVVMDSSGQNAYINQNILTVGRRYRVLIAVEALSVVNKLDLINSSGITYQNLGAGVGVNIFEITANQTAFRIRTKDGATSTISKASVQEITDGDFDFTRGTAATRVNSQGLIENVQILGSELVTNGTFDTDLSGWINGSNYWQWSNGRAYHPFGSVNNGLKITGLSTKKYKLTFDVEVIQGALFVELGTATSFTQSGTYTIFGVANYLNFKRNQSFEGYIDNVSLVEVTDNTNLPRIDFLGGTGQILLEPASTNTATYSNDFTQGDIFNQSNPPTLNDAVLTANQGTAPDGTNTASLLKDNNNGGTGQSNLNYFGTVVVSDNFNTFSVFAKKSLSSGILMELGGYDDGFPTAAFNLENGTLGFVNSNITAKIEDYGSGWYRCQATFQTTTDVQGFARIGLTTSTGNPNITRDGTNGVLLFGLQAEADASRNFATSYIPTSGSTVTRNKEEANSSGDSSLISSTEGVLYAEIAALADDATVRRISITDGTVNNRVEIAYFAVSNKISVSVKVSGSDTFSSQSTANDITQFNKIAVKYKVNDFNLFINGVRLSTDTSGAIPTGLDTLNFDSGSGTFDFFGKVKSVALFKEALDNDELECLTGSGFDSFTALAQAGSYTII